LFIARPKFEDLARFLFGETLAKWEPRQLINLNESDVMIDIGANTGYYTLHLAKKNSKAKIISIEADPQTSKILEENCKLNLLSNVKIYNMAVSNKSGKLALYQSNNNSGANSIFSSYSDNSKKVFVDSNTLDSILENEKIENIDWIKIDVEGAELSVLQGSPRTLQKTKKILIEVHEHILNQNNHKSQEILEILKDNGFTIRLFSQYWNPITSPNQTLKSDYILGER
jgi:FkbM family methyltransferase